MSEQKGKRENERERKRVNECYPADAILNDWRPNNDNNNSVLLRKELEYVLALALAPAMTELTSRRLFALFAEKGSSSFPSTLLCPLFSALLAGNLNNGQVTTI